MIKASGISTSFMRDSVSAIPVDYPAMHSNRPNHSEKGKSESPSDSTTTQSRVSIFTNPSHAYQPAAALLCELLKLDGITFQEVEALPNYASCGLNQHLAAVVRTEGAKPPRLPRSLLLDLLRRYPLGNIFFVDEVRMRSKVPKEAEHDPSVQPSTLSGSQAAVDEVDDLCQSIPGV